MSAVCQPVVYALEGAVAVCGSLMQWLRDDVELFTDVRQSEAIALSVPDTRGLYIVPAFSGLLAPYVEHTHTYTYRHIDTPTHTTHPHSHSSTITRSRVASRVRARWSGHQSRHHLSIDGSLVAPASVVDCRSQRAVRTSQ